MRSTRSVILGCLLLVFAIFGRGAHATHAASSASGEFTFAVFGDNHGTNGIFKGLLRDMSAQNPAFAVNTGDSINGSTNERFFRQQYKNYTDAVAVLTKLKIYHALGNHEIMGIKSHEEFFAKEMGALYYSFDYAGSHFIILDTEIVGQEGRIAGKQLEWLKDDLAKSQSASHNFIFMHRPMYPVDGHLGECLDKYPRERDFLHDLFVRNKVTAVFTGHEHLFNHQVRSGIHYFINGGAGGEMYPSFAGDGDFHHYLLVSVEGDRVTIKVVKLPQGGRPRQVLDL